MQHPDRDQGFTLIELLIVIVILGILATVVVFAVGGITDRGTDSAKAADEKTIVVAEEAYKAQEGSYTDEQGLVDAGLMRDLSTLHDITLAGGDYTLTYVGPGGSPAPTPPTQFAGFNGETLGSGPNVLILIDDIGNLEADWNTYLATCTPVAPVTLFFVSDPLVAPDLLTISSAGGFSSFVVDVSVPPTPGSYFDWATSYSLDPWFGPGDLAGIFGC